MTSKPLAFHPQARADIEQASTDYAESAGVRIALAYVDRVEEALESIRRHPSAGSLRWAYELGLPGLRVRTVKRYPHLIFYVEGETSVVVWRVLHGKRDIPSWIHKSDDEPER